MKTAAGAMACAKVLDKAAMERKNIDMVSVQVKVKSRNTKNGPGSLRKFVMK